MSNIILWNQLPRKQRQRIEKCQCPDCGGALLEGSSGGASTNVLCESCRSEFNFHPFGFERSGKASAKRAMGAFGADTEPVEVKLWIAQPSWWKRLFSRWA